MKIDVLDHGYVELVETMGDDRTPARCARTSRGNADEERTPEQDLRLLDYLIRNSHNTPVEFCQLRFYVKMPIFVARQLIRHRTQCIAGDVPVSFDLPGGNTRNQHGGGRRHYTLTMRELYERWQPTKGEQGDPLFKRKRVQQMLLRSVDEQTNEIYHARVKDVWSSGVKSVYQISFEDGSELRSTMDHRCLTTLGWLSVEEALEQGALFLSTQQRPVPRRIEPVHTAEELSKEEWRLTRHPDFEVSDLGRVRSWINTRRVRQPIPRFKQLTLSRSGYHVVSLPAPDGSSRAHLIHHLVLEAFRRPSNTGEETRHLDGCRTNNRISNLCWGSSEENAGDRMMSGGDRRLGAVPVATRDVTYLGDEECFDLEVEGTWPNFIAGGVVVHNSINEISYRYVTAAREYYLPRADEIRRRADGEKQGASGGIVDEPTTCRLIFQWSCERAHDDYERLLGHGVAPELARIVLPLATYTEWYTQMNLHNFLHMAGLRIASDAQRETRLYARAMLRLARVAFPNAVESWARARGVDLEKGEE